MRQRSLLILRQSDPEPVELLLAMILLVFGLALLLPQPLFTNGLVYHAMSTLASEEVWGVVLVALGVNGILSVLSGKRRYRRFTLLCKFAMFILLATLFVLSSPVTAGWNYFLYAAAALWAYWRIGREPT